LIPARFEDNGRKIVVLGDGSQAIYATPEEAIELAGNLTGLLRDAGKGAASRNADEGLDHIRPSDIGRIRDRLHNLEEVVADINAIPSCMVDTIKDVQWDKALISVTVRFLQRDSDPIGGAGDGRAD
jgi:hypothetical protein